MVDAIVGILVLAVVALSVSSAFSTLAKLDKLETTRIDSLAGASDAAKRLDWY
jgi:hypothetical protein